MAVVTGWTHLILPHHFFDVFRFHQFFKPLSNVEDAADILAKQSLSLFDYAALISLASDTGYKLGDNVEYLSKYKVCWHVARTITNDF